MPKQDVLLKNVEIPEGYEPTGEFRTPLHKEPYIDRDGDLVPKIRWKYAWGATLDP